MPPSFKGHFLSPRAEPNVTLRFATFPSLLRHASASACGRCGRHASQLSPRVDPLPAASSAGTGEHYQNRRHGSTGGYFSAWNWFRSAQRTCLQHTLVIELSVSCRGHRAHLAAARVATQQHAGGVGDGAQCCARRRPVDELFDEARRHHVVAVGRHVLHLDTRSVKG